MNEGKSPIRVLLCDVYGTLLEFLPPPVDAEERWQDLFKSTLGTDTTVSLSALAGRCQHFVEADHILARAKGIRHPEVDWARVMVRALPELAGLDADQQSDFQLAHIRLRHRVMLAPGAADCLHFCREKGVVLGLVSNAQAYTLRELDEALAGTGLSTGDFDERLTFWSFAEGFSKPDPGVFARQACRLAEWSILPGEALMVGDRRDNDILPARAAGFCTWQLGETESADGSWGELMTAWADSGFFD